MPLPWINLHNWRSLLKAISYNVPNYLGLVVPTMALYSDTLSTIVSDICSDLYSDIQSDIHFGTYLAFYLTYNCGIISNIFYGNLFDIFSGNLSGIRSDI